MAKAKNSKQFSVGETAAYRAQWNIPDWANPEEYEYVKTLKENQIRWEFLRRDKNYHADWAKRKPYGFIKYELNEWYDPTKKGSPVFTHPCYLVDFSERDRTKRYLHYAALADSKAFGGFIFNVDGNSPLKPQVDYITAVYEKYAGSASASTDRRKREKRKSNKNGRSPAFLLRVLDADNERVHINDLAEAFGGENGTTTSAMRSTLAFAHGYWRRF